MRARVIITIEHKIEALFSHSWGGGGGGGGGVGTGPPPGSGTCGFVFFQVIDHLQKIKGSFVARRLTCST